MVIGYWSILNHILMFIDEKAWSFHVIKRIFNVNKWNMGYTYPFMVWNLPLSWRSKLGFQIPVLVLCNLVFHALTIWPERSTTQRRAFSTKVFMYWKRPMTILCIPPPCYIRIVKTVRKFSTISFEPNIFLWIISVELNLIKDMLLKYYEKILTYSS